MFKKLLARLRGLSDEAEQELPELLLSEFRGCRVRMEALVHEIGVHRMDIANEILDLEQEDDRLQDVQNEIEAFLGA